MNLESFLRGVLGIAVLTAVLYVFSSNRKAISWRLVIIGFLLQLAFAVGIIHIPLVASLFDKISSFFVVILDFTRQGSSFVFGSLLDVKSFGFIFCFQILPT